MLCGCGSRGKKKKKNQELEGRGRRGRKLGKNTALLLRTLQCRSTEGRGSLFNKPNTFSRPSFPMFLILSLLRCSAPSTQEMSHQSWDLFPLKNLSTRGLNEDGNFPNFQKPFHKICQAFVWVLELKASPSLLWSWGTARVSSLNLKVGRQIGRGE